MQQLERETRRLAQQLADVHAYENIIGNHPLMLEVFGMIDSVAPVDITVLITGESGTGKELVARAIHTRSPRSNKPFAALSRHRCSNQNYSDMKKVRSPEPIPKKSGASNRPTGARFFLMR